MTFLYITAAISVVISGFILFPRIFVQGEFNGTIKMFTLACFWFSVHADLRTGAVSGSIFGLKFPRPEKKSRPKQKPLVAEEPAKSKEPGVAEFQDDLTEPTSSDGERTLPEEFTVPPETEDLDQTASQGRAEPTDEQSPQPREFQASDPKSEPDLEPDIQFSWFSFLWAEQDLVKRILGWIISGGYHFVRSIRKDYFRFHLCFGTGDPMATGIVFGIISPLFALNGPRTLIDLEPNFDQSELTASLSCSFSMRPLQAVGVIFREAWKFPWGETIRAVLRVRRELKN